VILVVGLGNPGPRYEKTRHNVGFVVVDRLLEKVPDARWSSRFSGDYAQGDLSGTRVGLLKPGTYMNESGRSVRAAAAFYKISASDIVVVHDELDLPLATVRVKRGGGEAGHNGLRSVSQELGTQDYVRVRLGVGKPPPDFAGGGADYVLQAFAPAERALVDDLLDRGAAAVTLIAARGLEEAMNRTSRREKS
jgi:PTH1 family peptidyl-tRNA hydrolase